LALGTAILLVAGCAHLDYPRLGIHEDVVRGGQAQIDQGHVVDVDGLPGDWLAGHRTSGGGVFYSLVAAQVGDSLTWRGQPFVVAQVLVVAQSWKPRYLGPLVLQTSLPEGDLLVVCQPG